MSRERERTLSELYDALDAYDVAHGRRPMVHSALLCALFGEDYQKRLGTAQGRAWLARKYWEHHHRLASEGGREISELCAAAAAIEEADWPTLGQILAKVERQRWLADYGRIEHLKIARFARRLVRKTKGSAP